MAVGHAHGSAARRREPLRPSNRPQRMEPALSALSQVQLTLPGAQDSKQQAQDSRCIGLKYPAAMALEAAYGSIDQNHPAR